MIKSDFSRINEALELLIELKNTFRQIIPTSTLDSEQLQKIKSKIIKLNRTLAKLNEQFGIEIPLKQKGFSDLKDNLNKILLIVNSPKNRKKLIDIGFNSEQILSTGGPITIADIKTLNSKMPESNIQNMKKKIQIFWKILKSKVERKEFQKLILLLEKGNIADEILMNRKDKFEKNLSVPVQTIIISSFDKVIDEFPSKLFQ
ncbi:MAG: DUF2100 domain-containing protein [Candidatus Helarchaeota archaeon]|nr:DUF2100 domain-containing protein [Candidatus Helarchaeota archaeon]